MYKKRLFHCTLASLPVLALAGLLLWLGAASPAQANPDIRHVATAGSDSSNDCTDPGNPCATIQHAINVAGLGDEIQVADGTFSVNGTVAVITKQLAIIGGFDPTFSVHDSNVYQTVLDAQWGGPVVNVANVGDVTLGFLTLTHGDGTGNCGSDGCGGGVYATDTNLHVSVCVITDNVGSKAGQGLGGGVYAHGGHVEIWESRIVNNIATTAGDIGFGGGVYLYGVTQANVLSSTIQGNKAGSGNSSTHGGGLWLGYSTSVYVAGNHIENNWTNLNHSGHGGGVYVTQSDAHLARNTIISNATLPSGVGWLAPGGGVYVASSIPVTLSNNLVVRNAASTNDGGGVYVAMDSPPTASRAILVNNTIADNGSSGVVVQYYAALTMTNNLIAGHTVGVVNTTPASSTVSADTNLFWNSSDPFVGSNAVQQNPLLTVDYRLGSGSPAVDAGLTIPWLTTDLAGSPRPQGSGYDIGAFEGEVASAWKKVFLPLVVRN